MRKLNLLYRGLDKTTDVLSFPLTDHVTDRVPDQSNAKGMPLPGNALGDIVVSIPMAVAQAETYGVSFRNELLRLLIHGLLHLIGYDHEKNAYQKKRMQTKERELIDALTSVD